MTQREQSLFHILIITLIACGAVLLILRQVNLYYRELSYERTEEVLQGIAAKHESSSSEDQKINWKTFANEQYGFEFQYPGDLTLRESKIFQIFKLYISVTKEHQKIEGELYYPTSPQFSVSINSSEKSPRNTLLDYLKDYPAYDVSNISDTKFLGFPATELISPETSSTYYKLTLVSKNNYNYLISLGENSKQIFSTFKFIK